MTAPTRLDHLVLGAPDLEAAVAMLEQRTGLRAAPGGRHPDRGTRNALLALGPRSYLEILAPDPERTRESTWLDVASLPAPRLVAWAVRTHDFAAEQRRVDPLGISFGPVSAGARARSDGTILRWRLTDPERAPFDRTLPFLLDWGDSEHPAQRAPAGLTLRALHLEHPAAHEVELALARLDLPLDVRLAERAAIVAELDSPRGPLPLS